MSQLRIRTRTTPSGPVIELAGELDHDSAPEIRDLLPGLPIKHGQQLVVDLGGLTLCDSSGISVLIAARNVALDAHSTIVLTAVPDMVSRTLSMVGLDQVFPTRPTAQAAEAAWTPATG
ncbi:STAS domain-containing protein [Streptomyces sp. NPDC056121]|uniref:STAS domain-containing protein n=1 Tax=Streptomyces TaxID=1883 RepID=UPI001D0A33A4|nr:MULTISPECIES: STAS domain-containing protein [Streptomyces]MCX5084132.1 STAS domain-containing protein [Streptomyces sp. NBC_00401]UDM04540.1 STAS domain-containing protein [Streptomyces longhuiensis]